MSSFEKDLFTRLTVRPLCKRLPYADRDIFETLCQTKKWHPILCHLGTFRKFGISQETFLFVLDQLLIRKVNWPRALSLVGLPGILAFQCAENCEENKIDPIQDWVTSVAEVKLRPWIEAFHGNGMIK